MRFYLGIVSSIHAVALALALTSRASAEKSVPTSAETLFQRAQDRFAQASLESRVAALRDFAAATEIAPERPEIWIAYGRACRESGQSAKARSCFSRAAELRPADSEVWSDLGAEWKNDWLLTTDRSSLDESLRCFARATELTPDHSGSWCAASALLLLEGRPKDALGAALRARRADSTGYEPLLVFAASCYRLSVLVYADSAFRMARDRMPADLRRRFDDDSVLRTRQANSDTSGTRGAGHTVWRDTDPDLTTPENEALLDYRTRKALAFFLFRDRGALRWDARADLFVRLGPPAAIQYNLARQGWASESEITYSRHRELKGPDETDYLPEPNGYPYNMQVWHYPELGIRTALIDRGLTSSYEIRPSLTYDRDDARVVPDSLAKHPELIVIGSGRGVFRALAPGVQPMRVAGDLSRFIAGDSTLIQAHVSASGGSADSMSGSWAIVADDGTVVKRGTAALSISACDPASKKVATFAATVPTGGYRVDLAVAARGGRRGVVHLRTRVDPVPLGFGMSDLVLVCGDPSMAAGSDAVRIEPHLSRQLTDSHAVTAYYELYQLVAASNGERRFSFHYTIRAADEPGNSGPGPVLIESSRDETSIGSQRRQFVTAAIGSLAPGRYELRVEVHDLIGGGEASGATEFVKVGPQPGRRQ